MSAWLIDMGYVVGASHDRFRIDYLKTRRQIAERLGAQPLSIIFNSFDPHRRAPAGLESFYEQMKQSDFLVWLYEMEGGRQRMVDVAIAATAVYCASKGDDVVLTSGDIDFLPAVDLIVGQLNRKLILFAYDIGVHRNLINAASDYWRFEDLRKRIEKL